jgi:hypothetical protein
MNQQVKQLIEQAGTDVSGKWINVNNAEKFAELVVQECIQILANNGYDDAGQCLNNVYFGLGIDI